MEILAPAGSIAALKAAIKGGANAVYLGLGEHNARLKSSDFTPENLSEWVDYAHLFGVKVHVTLNTAVKDDEIDRVLTLARIAAQAGADALIVSDIGIVKMISEISDIPIHLSTQAGVQNALDAIALEGLRIKRLILARETLISDIAEIKKHVEEVEIFAQGAICVAFSGGCLLGSKIYDSSGNRGACNQPCRLTYEARNEKGDFLAKGKLLSPSDLSLGEKVLLLEKLGVTSIKIEGRLKRPLYVYAATKYYRDLLQGKDVKEDIRDLKESFHRGFTKGYTLMKSAPIINVKTSSHIGIPVGKVVSVSDRNGYKFASVSSDYSFRKGDGAKILRNGEEIGGSDVTSVRQEGGLTVIPVSAAVKKGDIVCLTTSAEKVEAAERIVNKLPVILSLRGKVGEPIELIAKCGVISASVKSESVAQASHSADNAALIEKISKVGNTDFCVQKTEDRLEGALFVNASELNAMRREVLASLREGIVSAAKPTYRFDAVREKVSVNPPKSPTLIVEVGKVEDIVALAGVNKFILSPDRCDDGLSKLTQAANGRKCYLRLPKIMRECEISYLEKLLSDHPSLGIYADNLYGVALARKLGRGYIAGFGLNVFNGETASFYGDADHVAASIEHPYAGDLVYRAGKIPLMSFAHCPISVVSPRNCAQCRKETSCVTYTNDDHVYRIVRREYASCDFTMYEDAITNYPVSSEKSSYYSLMALTNAEKELMIRNISEEISE